MTPVKTKIAPFLACCGIFLSIAAGAQSNLETNAGIQFNLSTPGAGNLALGGAFLALADDATAAYTNPAGLLQLAEPEVHLELRAWRYTHVFTDRGRLEGRSPTGEGIDDIEGLQAGEADDRQEGVSFLSYVYPKRRWALALYRHELANFEANFETQGAFLERTRSRGRIGFPILSDGRLASLRNTMSLRVVNHGVAAAWRVHSRFTLGAGLTVQNFFLGSRTERFLPPLFEAPDFRPENVTNVQTQTGEDSALAFNLGWRWESASRVWSAGGIFRQGPSFDVEVSSEPGPRAFLESAFARATKFHVPEIYGVGVAYQPRGGSWRLAFDYDRVEYSDMKQDFVDIFNVQALFGIDPELEAFRIDDADELHFGAEYSLGRLKTPLSLRFGLWYDPDHSLYFTGENPGLGAVYRRRDDELHYSGGIGLSLQRVQIDAAFDYSERFSTVALSAAWRL